MNELSAVVDEMCSERYDRLRMSDVPSPNGSNGERDAHGRFAKGNPGGPGNPYGRSVARWRELFHEAITEEDFRAIVAAMVHRAKEGDMTAAREILNRLAGRPPEALDPERESITKDQLKLRERQVDLQEEAIYARP